MRFLCAIAQNNVLSTAKEKLHITGFPCLRFYRRDFTDNAQVRRAIWNHTLPPLQNSTLDLSGSVPAFWLQSDMSMKAMCMLNQTEGTCPNS
eukprot:3950580-Amphidinium_carterae.1